MLDLDLKRLFISRKSFKVDYSDLVWSLYRSPDLIKIIDEEDADAFSCRIPDVIFNSTEESALAVLGMYQVRAYEFLTFYPDNLFTRAINGAFETINHLMRGSEDHIKAAYKSLPDGYLPEELEWYCKEKILKEDEFLYELEKLSAKKTNVLSTDAAYGHIGNDFTDLNSCRRFVEFAPASVVSAYIKNINDNLRANKNPTKLVRHNIGLVHFIAKDAELRQLDTKQKMDLALSFNSSIVRISLVKAMNIDSSEYGRLTRNQRCLILDSDLNL